jgi:hypothetical protein
MALRSKTKNNIRCERGERQFNGSARNNGCEGQATRMKPLWRAVGMSISFKLIDSKHWLVTKGSSYGETYVLFFCFCLMLRWQIESGKHWTSRAKQACVDKSGGRRDAPIGNCQLPDYDSCRMQWRDLPSPAGRSAVAGSWW